MLLYYLQTRFTLTAVIAACAIALLLQLLVSGGLPWLLHLLIAPFGYDFHYSIGSDPGAFMALFWVSVPSVIILYLSETIDGTDDETGKVESNRIFSLAMAAVNGIMLFVLWSYASLLATQDNFDAMFEESFFGALFTTGVIVILVFVLMVPALIFGLLFIPAVAVTIIAGILCLPHVIMYHATIHPLRGVPKKALAKGQVPAEEVISGLGGDPASFVGEKAKLHQLRRMIAELDTTRLLLQQERAVLKQNIREATERKEAEIEVSNRLAEIDVLLAENARYKAQLKERPDT